MGVPAGPAGKSLVPTREVTFAFARPRNTAYLTWRMPESSYKRIHPDIEATLESLRFFDNETPAPRGY
jgi:hypothetical protein